jgi:hypothetical protein
MNYIYLIESMQSHVGILQLCWDINDKDDCSNLKKYEVSMNFSSFVM